MIIHDQIMDAVHTALNTDQPLGVPVVVREQGFSIESSALPSMILNPVKETGTDATGKWGPLQRRTFTMVVECRARGIPAESIYPSQAVSPLWAWVVKTLGGQTLGGLVHRVTVGDLEWVYDQADHLYCLVPVLVMVEYQIRVGDAEARS